MKTIWQWIEYNRFTVVIPIAATLVWLVAFSCTPVTTDPLRPDRLVDVKQLEISFKSWQAEQEIITAKYEAAGADLEQQKQNNEKIEEVLTQVASGGVADLPGLLKLLIGGGALGAIADNIRKRGLIAGLKRNNA